MKTKLITIFFILFTGLLLGQDSVEIVRLQKEIVVKDSTINSMKNQIDSIFKKTNLNHSGKITISSDSEKSIWEFFFPSLIILIVALIALGGTIYAGKKQRILSEKQLKEQLNQSQSTLKEQIKTARDTAELTFRQNVLSGNRQNWINKLRDIISEVISLVGITALKKRMSDDDFRQLNILLIKAELMVNPDKDKEFIKALKALNLACLQVITGDKNYSDLTDYRTDVLNYTKTTLKTEWERVKKGE